MFLLQLLLFDNYLPNYMSEVQIKSQRVSRVSFFSRESAQDSGNALAEQVINNSMFKLLLKDIVQGLINKTEHYLEEKDEQKAQVCVPVDSFIDDISDSLILIAKTEATKQIKETEKFLTEMYAHKIRQLEDHFEELMSKKMKEFDQKIQKVQTITKTETSLFSHKQFAEIPQQKNQICKRAELKQKILNTANTSYSSEVTNMASQSVLSDSSGNDPSLQKLTEKIKQMEQNFKHQFKTISQKVSTIKTQIRTQMNETEATFKEQLNSGFQGIWNVISNLEKRMIL